MTNGILELLTDSEKYHTIKENTKRRRELFDWNIIANEVKKVYERLLK
jgi:glycosyltransferase involved in cell wall biosynthesis